MGRYPIANFLQNLSMIGVLNNKDIRGHISFRGCLLPAASGLFKNVVQSCPEASRREGRSPFCARSVLAVREHGKMARTPLAAFFNRPMIGLVVLVYVIFALLSPAIASLTGLRITIHTFSPHFSPTVAKIITGTSISWDNPTSTLHSITHDGCQKMEPCAFDSGPLGPNRTFSIDALPPGQYPYHCSFHPIMRGTLVVLESDTNRET